MNTWQHIVVAVMAYAAIGMGAGSALSMKVRDGDPRISAHQQAEMDAIINDSGVSRRGFILFSGVTWAPMLAWIIWQRTFERWARRKTRHEHR